MDYQFCPRCGGEAEQAQENMLLCQECGYEFYINPIPANGAIITNEEGEMLFIKRNIEPSKGKFDFPGGFVDLNETAEESMLRELKEETGLTPQKIKYFNSYIDRYLYQDVNLQVLCLIYEAQVSKESKLTPGDDAEECIWVKPSEIDFDKLAFEGTKKTVREWKNRNRQMNN